MPRAMEHTFRPRGEGELRKRDGQRPQEYGGQHNSYGGRNMDISQIGVQIVDRLKADPDLLGKFKQDPLKTLETLSGIDLPDSGANAVVAAVKAKLGDGDIASTLGALGGLFKK